MLVVASVSIRIFICSESDVRDLNASESAAVGTPMERSALAFGFWDGMSLTFVDCSTGLRGTIEVDFMYVGHGVVGRLGGVEISGGYSSASYGRTGVFRLIKFSNDRKERPN